MRDFFVDDKEFQAKWTEACDLAMTILKPIEQQNLDQRVVILACCLILSGLLGKQPKENTEILLSSINGAIRGLARNRREFDAEMDRQEGRPN